ncbi:hypothetical protein LCGC14_0170490 [marine sediment metagenome]|mgnify:CR=1 FL=1|jgi:hypothetical protein|uniref:Uncharacterized protein n=1 Tax=marine sediment metagenome TaxID=412755 RepID=A0A0F9USN1_9ZZZZ
MSKQIFAHELAEIVTGLLIKPELLGELDSADRHADFLGAIAGVVADFCGGEVSMVEASRSADPIKSTVYLRVNDSLPAVCRNVWSNHDLTGWEKEEAESQASGEDLEPMSRAEAKATRKALQKLLTQAAKSFSA